MTDTADQIAEIVLALIVLVLFIPIFGELIPLAFGPIPILQTVFNLVGNALTPVVKALVLVFIVVMAYQAILGKKGR